MSVSDILGILGFFLAVSLAISQYVEKRQAIIPIFGIKIKEVYAEHFKFSIQNKNTEPISIKKVIYPSRLYMDQMQSYPEEFGAVVLEDLRDKGPMKIAVHYQMKNGKNKVAQIDLVMEDQNLYIDKQVHKNK